MIQESDLDKDGEYERLVFTGTGAVAMFLSFTNRTGLIDLCVRIVD